MTIFTADDIEQMEQRYRAHFINSLSGFKSANLIGTCSTDKQTNVAIVSSVVHLGAQPPLMAYINRPASVPRHTLNNILATGHYTINHVNENIITAAHQTSARYPQSESEFAATGLNEYWNAAFPAPFVAESRLRLGLDYVEHHTLLNETVMVIGRITYVELAMTALTGDGYIDIESLGSVAVSGLDSYHKSMKLQRLSYAKPGLKPQAID